MSTIRAVSSAVATTLLLALALIINASLASDATPSPQQPTQASPQQESILARAAVLSDQRAKAAATRHHKKALADRSKRERQAALERAQRAKARTAPAPKKSSAPSTSVSRSATQRTSGPLTGWKARYWAEAQVWAQQPKTRSVIFCESSNDPQKVSKTGKYRGLYQMDADFWSSYGGLELASRPDLASRAAQNYVAYRGYVGNGWGRWECA